MNNDIVTRRVQLSIVCRVGTLSHDFSQFTPRMKQDEEVGLGPTLIDLCANLEIWSS